MNVASWLTVSRLFLMPPAILPVSLGWGNGWLVSAAITVVAGLTDIFDGFLARRMERISSLGINLDLLSDKVFVGAMLVFLAWQDIIPAWMPAVVIAREVAVSLVRLVRFRGQPPASDAWGKAKTAVSFVAIVWVLLWGDRQTVGYLAGVGVPSLLSSALALAPWVMALAVILTVVSGANYLVRYYKRG